jgi:hypothetical protein
LWADGHITEETIKAEHEIGNKRLALCLGIPRVVNKATGQESSRMFTFSEVDWRAKTLAYLQSINTSLRQTTFTKIKNGATAYAKINSRVENHLRAGIEPEEMVLDLGLVDLSDSDCKHCFNLDFISKTSF